MKAAELRQKSRTELEDLVVDLQKEQFNLRVQRSMQQAVKTHKFREARRTIARIKLVLSEKGE